METTMENAVGRVKVLYAELARALDIEQKIRELADKICQSLF